MNRFIARLLAGVLLFVQMAVAAHACPVMLSGPADGQGYPAVMAAGEMAAIHDGDGATNFGGTDSGLTSQCLGHCQFGQQNADSKHSPAPAAVLLTSLYPVPPLQQSAGLPRPLTSAQDPASLADPPHAILHCCFRL